MTTDDPLAPLFLEVCAPQWARSGHWSQARATFLRLMHDFPQTAQGRSSFMDLVAASFTGARTIEREKITLPTPGIPDASLHGKAMVQLTYNTPSEFSATGKQSSFVQLDKCTGCKAGKLASYQSCVKHAATAKITLDPGQYRIQVRFLSAALKQSPQWQENDYVLQGNAVLRPNHRYLSCVWSN